MSRSTNRFSTWRSLRQLVQQGMTRLRRALHSSPANAPVPRPFSYLQRLEDRNLPSATPIGTEFNVNTTLSGSQQFDSNTTRSVAMDPNGNYVVAWQGQGAAGWGIYAQRYNAAGQAQGGEIQVSTFAGGNQQHPAVAMDTSGNFAIAWQSFGEDTATSWGIYSRLYNSSGQAVTGETLINKTTSGNQTNPSIAMSTASNRYIVTWMTDQVVGQSNIFARDVRPNGVLDPNEYQINTVTGNMQQPAVAMDSLGDAVVVWRSNQLGGQQIFGQRLNNLGGTANFNGAAFQISTNGMAQQEPTVALDASGNFTVAWSSNQTSPYRGIFARSYNSSGTALGSEYQVDAQAFGNDSNPAVAYDGSGQVLIAWDSYNQDAASTHGIYAREYTTAGNPTGNAVLVNTTTAGDQQHPSVAADANGHAVVAWNGNGTSDSDGIFAQAFTTTSATSTGTGGAGIQVAGSDILVSQDGTLLRVNSATGAVVTTYTTGVADDGVIVGPDGSLYAADYYNNQILHYDPTGTFLSSFGSSAQLSGPQGLSFGPDGNLYVNNVDSSHNGFVAKFSPSGTFLGNFIPAGSGGLSNAKAIVWGPDGNAYVSSYFNSEVIRYNGTTGAFLNVFATGSGGFENLAFGPDGNLYVASYGDGKVYRYNGTTGAPLGAFVSGITTPYGLAFDAAGNLDVASATTGKVLSYSSTGSFRGTLQTGLTNPSYLSATTSLVTTEAGTSAKFNLALTTQPTGNVTITLTTSPSGQGSLSTSTLTFTPSNWNTSQSVTVTGLPDYQFDGDQFYQINGTATSTDSNYNNLLMSPVVVVNKEADTVTAVSSSSYSPTYGQTVTFTANVSGGPSASGTPTGTVTFVDGANVLGSASLVSGSATYTTSQLSGGSHTIAVSYSGDSSFAKSNSTPLTLTVNPAMLTVTTANATKVYGQPNPAFTASYSGFVNGDDSTKLAGMLTFSTPATAASSVGTYNVTPGGLSSTNYSITFVNGNLTVTPAALTVTTNNVSKSYGQPNPAFTASFNGFVNGDDSTKLGGTLTFSTPATASSSVGTYNVTPGGLSSSNYSITFATGHLTVTAAPLTVTANNASKVYGQANPAFTASFNGFVNGDDSTNLGGTLTFSTPATAGSHVGNYSVTPGGLSSRNYSITFSSGNLTITPAALTVTTNNISKVYGQPNPAFTASFTGFVNGDDSSSLGGTLTYSTTATASSSVGTYTVTPGGLTSTNYSITFSNGNLTVLPAALTVTTTNTSKVYGQPNPTFTASYSGFVSGDDSTKLGGTLTFNTPATASSSVGTYSVTPGGLSSSNYSITFSNGNLTINPAALTVTTSDTSKVYGQPNPAFTASFNGFVNGDDSTKLGGTLTFSTPATASSSVGTYNVTPGGLSSSNYSITFATGHLTVTAAPLTVTTNNASKVYGQANPAFTASFNGFVNGDDSTNLGGTLTFSTPATAGSHVGNYSVTPGGVTSFNYAITFANGTLTVTPAPVTVTSNATRVYGQTNPPLAATYTGLVNGDTPADLGGTPFLQTGNHVGSPTGSYTIVVGPGTLTDPDYAFTFVNGTLTITPAALTVTANNASKVYGQPNPAFTASFNGFVNGDDSTKLSGTLTFNTPATVASSVGTYSVTPGGLASSNYNITFASGNLIVTATSVLTVPPTPGQSVPVSQVVPSLPVLTVPSTSVPGVPSVPRAGNPSPSGNNTSGSQLSPSFPPSQPSVPPVGGIPSPAVSPVNLGSPTAGNLSSTTPANSAATTSTGVGFARSEGGSTPALSEAAGSSEGLQLGSVSGSGKALGQPGAFLIRDALLSLVETAVPPPDPLVLPSDLATIPLVVQMTALPTSEPLILPVLPPELTWQDLRQMTPLPDLFGLPPEASALLGSGVLAGAGYVLLNTRAGFWLLSLLTARPVWKQFDPMEVLFAWEQEGQQRDEADGETLVSMVE